MKLPPYQSQTLDNIATCHSVPFHTAHSHYGADYNRSSACQVLQSSEKRNPECLDGPVNFSVLAGQWNCFWFWAGRGLALIHGVDKAATKSIYNNIQYTIVTNYTGIKTFKVNIKAWQNMTQNLHSTNTRIYRLI